MANNDVFKRQTVVFYKDEEELFQQMAEIAKKNKQSMRGAIILALEHYVKLQNNTDGNIIQPERQIYVEPRPDSSTKDLFK